MNFITVESREGFGSKQQGYLIFEKDGQKFVCDSQVVSAAAEFGIEAQDIKNTLRTNRNFAGINNYSMTEDDAREVLEAAMPIIAAQPELVS